MNLTTQYKVCLNLFTLDPVSDLTEDALAELVRAFALEPYPVAIVDLININRVKEAEQGFWQVLEHYGLCVRFIPRRHGFAFVTLQLSLAQTNFVGVSLESERKAA